MADVPEEFLARATIFQRMAAILDELPPIGKDQENTQQHFMFRGHDDVLNALNPLLAKYRVFVVPEVLDRAVAQRQTRNGTVMYEVNLLVRYRFYGAGGDYVEASAWGEGTDMGDKSTNKAMTMAFKNVLNQAFAISNKEASDADATSPEETVVAAAVAVSEADQKKNRIDRIEELIAEVADAEEADRDEVHDDLVLAIGAFDGLTIQELNDLGLNLRNRLNEAKARKDEEPAATVSG